MRVDQGSLIHFRMLRTHTYYTLIKNWYTHKVFFCSVIRHKLFTHLQFTRGTKISQLKADAIRTSIINRMSQSTTNWLPSIRLMETHDISWLNVSVYNIFTVQKFHAFGCNEETHVLVGFIIIITTVSLP